MNKYRKAIVMSGLMSLLCAGVAIANEAIIEERQDGFSDMGASMKTINGELKSDAPDIAKINKSAETLAALAAKVPSWFPEGSGPESGLDTDALAYIWKNSEKFSKTSDDFAAASQALVAASKGTDIAAIKTQFMAVKDSCGSCHESFRAD